MKHAALIALILIAICQVWAGPIVFGDVNSEIAGDFLNLVKDSADRDEIFTRDTEGPYTLIQITDQGVSEFMDGTKTMVTVSLGFSEDDDEPEVMPFGKYYMYAPLKTIVILLDSSRQEESLNDAIVTLGNAAATLTEEVNVYIEQQAQQYAAQQKRQEENYRIAIKAELTKYGAKIIKWLKTPLSQGGAGSNLSAKDKSRLVDLLGLNANFAQYYEDGDYTIKLIGITGPDEILLMGYPTGYYQEGYPVIYLDISITSREYSIY
mgnify:CR=1 FL=1